MKKKGVGVKKRYHSYKCVCEEHPELEVSKGEISHSNRNYSSVASFLSR